jgi:hypothetical protein
MKVIELAIHKIYKWCNMYCVMIFWLSTNNNKNVISWLYCILVHFMIKNTKLLFWNLFCWHIMNRINNAIIIMHIYDEIMQLYLVHWTQCWQELEFKLNTEITLTSNHNLCHIRYSTLHNMTLVSTNILTC